MSGITPATTPVIPNYESDGTAFAVNIGHAINALARPGFAFAPYAQATPNMTVALAAGHIPPNLEVAAQSTGTITAPSTHPRKDLVVVDNATGAVSVVTGTEAASPVVPALPSGKSRVAEVTLAVGQTSITAANLADVRDLALLGLGDGATKSGGTSAGSLVVVQAGGKLPAVDGSQLTNLPASGVDLSMMTAMLVWRSASRASGPIPSGYLNTFQTDELATKTNATYDAANKLYTNQTSAQVNSSYTTVGNPGAYTIIDRTMALPNNASITHLGIHSSAAKTGQLRIYQRTAANTYSRVAYVDISHTGSGLEFFALATAYVVPASGTFYVGAYCGNFSSSGFYSTTRAYVGGDVTSGSAFTEDSSTTPELGYKYMTAATNMVLVPAAVTLSTPKSLALTIEHIPIVAVTLNTDLIAEASIDGGTTWAQGALAKLCDMDSTAGSQLLKATVDVSAQTGSSVKWRLTTANAKAQSVRCVGLYKAA